MKVVQRNVFYCDFCRKHGLSRSAMEKHEIGCTMNPARVCRWSVHEAEGQFDTEALAVAIRERAATRNDGTLYVSGASTGEPILRTCVSADDIAWLHDEVGGCPACMLAVLRQSGVDDFHHDAANASVFDYQAEVERFRQDERRADEYGSVW